MAVWESTTYTGSIPDATDAFDLADALIAALTGVTTPTTGTLPSVEEWTVLKDDTTSVPGERFIYLEGPGLSGTDNINVNIHIYDGTLNVQNWEIKGAIGFSAGLDFDNQPGGHAVNTGSILTLRVLTMPFRIIASGRRFIILPRVVASNFSCYCGFYLPFGTPSEIPHPLIIAGNCAQYDGYANANDYRLGNFYDGPEASTTAGYTWSCFSIRHIDGSWTTGGRYNTPTTGSTSRPSTQYNTLMWPWDYEDDEADANRTNPFDHALFTNPNNSHTLLPAIPYSKTNSMAYGELEGVYYSPTSIFVTEDTVTVGSDTYFIVANCYRGNEVNALFKGV